MKTSKALFFGYDKCDTCRKARKWLAERRVEVTVRPIVESPPTETELKRYLALSKLPVRKWLNTSGQSYRALGKEAIDAASDATLLSWLAKDGKLIKRPVLVVEDQQKVVVGFQTEAYEALFSEEQQLG